MDESIAEFVKSVRIEDCRVHNTPNLVFLCGGPTAKSDSDPYRSARDYFHRYVRSNAVELAKRVKLAEEINNWFNQDTFADLLELEVYLADLCDLTVLFVESPGSIAELGAFAASDSLRPKTLAVLNSAHPPDRTFISDGPVRRIKACDPDLVRYYDLDSENLADPSTQADFEEMSRELTDYLNLRQQSAAKERKIDERSFGHTMLLIADLVDIVGITFGTEIIECLSEWGYTVDRKTLQKYLSLLEHLGLVKRKLYSTQTYYLSANPSVFIRYDFRANTKVRDRDRIKALIRSAFASEDPVRSRVLQKDLGKRPRKRQSYV